VVTGQRGGVVVLGEVLVELSTEEPLERGGFLRLDFSGDALNAAAAAAAAGAETMLLARVPDDELGDALLRRAVELGVDCSYVVRAPGQHGLYLTHADPLGERQFLYARQGSVGSGLCLEDLDPELLRSAAVVLASGVGHAVSSTAGAAVEQAARLARFFVYDPNLRLRLTTAADASAVLRKLAPLASLVTPSWPDETRLLLGTDPDGGPGAAARAVLGLGARAATVTCGERGVVVADGDGTVEVPALPAAEVVDQTGAGDSFAGTVAARLALGDDVVEAVRWGVAAAALSVQGRGGTGFVASAEQILTHRAAHERPRVDIE